jgi:hypothetical protein
MSTATLEKKVVKAKKPAKVQRVQFEEKHITPKPSSKEVAKIAADIQVHQRLRVWHLKSRNMVQNRLRATVAGTIGYSTGMDKEERAKLFKQADKMIAKIVKGELESDLHALVCIAWQSVQAFDTEAKLHEGIMIGLVKQLPIAVWLADEQQRGLGCGFAAQVIGECGDLSGYVNPGKVWRRMGCAPYTKEGETWMGATWRGRANAEKGTVKLNAEDWSAYGYSPRRRSVAYLIGKNCEMQNKSIYRKRYDEAKTAIAAKHPDYKPGRCDNHAMLLAAKLFLKNLWIVWNK